MLISMRDRPCLRHDQQRDQNRIGQPPRFSEKTTHESDYIPKSQYPKISDLEFA